LLIEGIGGLMDSLGEGFTVRDLVKTLHCEVIDVACNRLGPINHKRPTVEALKCIVNKGVKAVLMSHNNERSSAYANRRIPAERLSPAELFAIGFLGGKLAGFEPVKKS
jgi:dethiobiotin synthetase